MINDSTDAGLRFLAAQYIDKQLTKLTMHLQKGRTTQDIEDIHQVRVTCRRIRTALKLFYDCFEQDYIQTWEKQIKKLLRSFGTARDLDVQIAFLKDILNHLDTAHKKVRPGIRRMILRWQQRRNKAQTKVINKIDTLQKKHLLTEIHVQMEKILFELKPLKPPLESPAVYRRAHDQIQLRIRDFLSRQDNLKDPDDVSGHHALRIATKKLRYAMEICDTAVHGKLKSAIKKVKKVQTLLGDMHDCDVWDADICRFIEQEKDRTMDYYGHIRPFARLLPGLSYLQQERREHRAQLYRQACAYLDQLNEETFWVTFPQVLQQTTPSEQTEHTHDQTDEKKASENPDA